MWCRLKLDMTIRYGGSEDALSIRRAVFMEEQGISFADEMDGLDPTSYHLVAYHSHRPIACARFYAGDEPGQYHVGRVAVLPTFRGRGVGHALMQEVENWAIDHGASELRLNAQDSAVQFYRSLGYVVCDEPGFFDAGILHYAMVRDLRGKTKGY